MKGEHSMEDWTKELWLEIIVWQFLGMQTTTLMATNVEEMESLLNRLKTVKQVYVLEINRSKTITLIIGRANNNRLDVEDMLEWRWSITLPT